MVGGVVGANKESVYLNESVRNTSGVCCYKRNPQICCGLLSEIWMYVSKVWAQMLGSTPLNPSSSRLFPDQFRVK